MSMPIVVPGKEAGTLYIPALNRTIKQIEWREGDIFDSVQVPATAVTAGNKVIFFRDVTNKNLQHMNIGQPRKLPSGTELIMTRIALQIAQCFGNTVVTPEDILKVGHNASFTFKAGERLITEGPLFLYPSGYGFTGPVNDNTSATKSGTLTNGVPSVAAAPMLLVTQTLTDEHDLKGEVEFPDNAWLASNTLPTLVVRCVLTCLLHGFLKRPQGL